MGQGYDVDDNDKNDDGITYYGYNSNSFWNQINLFRNWLPVYVDLCGCSLWVCDISYESFLIIRQVTMSF